jgi:dihydrofolate reductase
MSKVRVNGFTISIDGFGAGRAQSLEDPLGVGGSRLHGWFYPTATFQRMIGGTGGTTGTDDEFARAGMEGVGAWILGRNMFGPIRGAWPDDEWKGWWGDEPPYHTPVFVLTHHPRDPLEMKGGTTFHFVTEGLDVALDRAREAAAGADVRIGGGVSVIRQCLQAGWIDELHLAVSPVLLGSGEHLLDAIDLTALGYSVRRTAATPQALHLVVDRDSASQAHP